MYGTSSELEYAAKERMAEYKRRADRQRLLAQAPRAPRTFTIAAFAHLILKVAARVTRRQGETSPAPGTPQAVNGEHIHIVTS
jgi:hypothetical protein